MPRNAKKGRITIYRQPPKLKGVYSNPETTPLLDKVSTQFQALPPLRVARQYADKEIADKALPTEIAWLYEHPVLWLRALMQMRKDVDSHIAKQRKELEARKRPNPPTPEYLNFKRQIDEQHLSKMHFLRMVERRLEDVNSMVGSSNPVINSDFVKILLKFVDLLDDDDITGAREYALAYVDRLEKQALKGKK